MNLYTGKKITRSHVVKQPISRQVIRAVEALGTRQGLKTFKVESKQQHPLYPVHWERGVDYYEEDDEIENDDDDEDYEEQEVEEDEDDDLNEDEFDYNQPVNPFHQHDDDIVDDDDEEDDGLRASRPRSARNKRVTEDLEDEEDEEAFPVFENEEEEEDSAQQQMHS